MVIESMRFEMIFKKKKSISEREVAGGHMNDIGKGDADAGVLANKGNELVESGMYAEAIRYYDRALGISPKLTEVWNNKGLALASASPLLFQTSVNFGFIPRTLS